MPSKFDFSEQMFRGADDLDYQEIFTLLFERVPCGLLRYRPAENGLIDLASKHLFKMLGCSSREEFDELTGGCFIGIVHPEDRERVLAEIDEQTRHSNEDMVTYRLNHRTGNEVWVADRGHKVVDKHGVTWFYVALIDVTDDIRHERELLAEQEKIDILTALSNDVLFDIDCASGSAQVYGAFEERFGRKPVQEDLMGTKRCAKDCHLDIQLHSLDHLMEQINENNMIDFETSAEGPDGEPVWYRYQSVVLFDDEGNPVRHVGRLLDTNDMMEREAQIRHKAERDDLTGIFKRSAAVDRINAALSSESTKAYTFFLIDVDDFKGINDTYGHPMGDAVLKRLGDFLNSTMRKEDIVARFGGDEFALFANGLGEGPALERVLNRLLRGPFAHDRAGDNSLWKDGEGPSPTITIGAVTTSMKNISFDDLYACADEALYEAKKVGKARYELKVLD